MTNMLTRSNDYVTAVVRRRRMNIERDEFNFYSTVLHEASHATSAGYYGKFSGAFVGNGFGSCYYDEPISDLEISVVSWAGNAAENMFDFIPTDCKRPAMRLTLESIPQFVAASTEETFSEPDWTGICRYPDKAASLRIAYNILVAKKDVVMEFADYLAANYRGLFIKLKGCNPTLADAEMKSIFENALQWHGGAENFRRSCQAKGIPDSQRLPIEKMNLDMMEINPSWITEPKAFLYKLLQKQKTNRKIKT